MSSLSMKPEINVIVINLGTYLLVLTDSPFAMQCWGQDAQDHDLHGVRHPAEADDEAQDDLELAEPEGVHGLRDGERVVGHHPGGGGRYPDLGADDVVERVVEEAVVLVDIGVYPGGGADGPRPPVVAVMQGENRDPVATVALVVAAVGRLEDDLSRLPRRAHVF